VIEIRARTPNLPVSDGENSAHRGLHRYAAAASPSLNPTEPDDSLAEVANLLGDESDLLPGRLKRLEVGLTPSRPRKLSPSTAMPRAGSHSKSAVVGFTNASISRRLNAAITNSASSTFSSGTAYFRDQNRVEAPALHIHHDRTSQSLVFDASTTMTSSAATVWWGSQGVRTMSIDTSTYHVDEAFQHRVDPRAALRTLADASGDPVA
jgi:hypothetical protein